TQQRARDPHAYLRRSRSHDAGTLLEIEWGKAERLLNVEQVDSKPQLATKELSSGNVDRARRLEGANGIDATGCEVAEREGERAHDPQAMREIRDLRRIARDERRAGGLEGEDLDLVLRPLRAERLAVQPRAFATPRRPLLA